MSSAVCSEQQAHTDRRRLSISLDVPPSSSPFPSPSSSFLPPPMPGAHEFAVKLPPAGRNSRKASIVQTEDGHYPPPTPDVSLKSPLSKPNGSSYPGETLFSPIISPTTPTPSIHQRQTISTPTTQSISGLWTPSSATTPTVSTATVPESTREPSTLTPITATVTPKSPTTSSSPSFYALPSPSLSSSIAPSIDTSALTSNRPAPPSPAISRRVSQAPSTSSAKSKSSRSSRPPSTVISRTNSTRKTTTNSPTLSRHSTQFSSTGLLSSSSPLPSPRSAPSSFVPPPAAALSIPGATKRTPSISLVVIRDFAFDAADERHKGLGPDVPRANRVARLNRYLRGSTMRDSVSSFESSGDDEEDDEDEEDEGWSRFTSGMGRFSIHMGGAGLGGHAMGNGRGGDGGFPSQSDLARNFLEDEDDDEEEQYFDPEGEGEEEEEEEEDEPLYPGLYRALYAFEPEGTAEIGLEEDQVVRVVGRGGGVGWAVVIDEREGMGDKHALVPESYLEPIRMDWEDEQDNARE